MIRETAFKETHTPSIYTMRQTIIFIKKTFKKSGKIEKKKKRMKHAKIADRSLMQFKLKRVCTMWL